MNYAASINVRDLCVRSRFEQQVLLHPDRVAVSLGDRSLTYRELDNLAEALAFRLRKRGVGPNALVGVLLERSLELIVAIVAVLKAAAAYVPLDCHYPTDRLLWMVSDTEIKTVLVASGVRSEFLDAIEGVVTVDLKDLAGKHVTSQFERPAHSIEEGEQLAYVMYTSGSTGTPKGVAIPHRGIVRLVCDTNFVEIHPSDVFLQSSPVAFDASTFEIWGALLNGARLAVLPPGPLSLNAIVEEIERQKVTVLWLTAGLFNVLVDERLEALSPVRQLLVGGEVLSVRHVERALAGLPNIQLINGYGPTENTTFTCCYRVPRGRSFPGGIPIGHPIRGTHVHIVDEDLRPIPAGEIGELVTGGLGLALGYWRRPELTCERFVDNPTNMDAVSKVYRTGDLARQCPDGSFEFLGRRDTQVKIRGFRVELGEIEANLRKHPGVRDCAVKAWVDTASNKHLTACIVLSPDQQLSAHDLRKYASEHLPDHMVPGGWVILDKLPLNLNGKVDRARLPEVAPIQQRGVRELPRNDLEKLIAGVWEEVLGIQSISISASYFELGGNSLLLAQVHDRLRCRHGLNLSLTDLFQYPTVRSLANHLDEPKKPLPARSGTPAMRTQLSREALSRFKSVRYDK